MKSIYYFCLFFLLQLLFTKETFSFYNNSDMSDIYGTKKIITYPDYSKQYYIVDTFLQDTILIDSYKNLPFFYHGFVYAKAGDLKDLFLTNGKRIIYNAHYIRFNDNDSILTAWICQSGWILANYKGDTLFFNNPGRHENNYMPNIQLKIFCAKVFSSDLNKTVFGYMNQKGKWTISPQYDEAEEFKNGIANVTLNGRTFKIDLNGKEIE